LHDEIVNRSISKLVDERQKEARRIRYDDDESEGDDSHDQKAELPYH